MRVVELAGERRLGDERLVLHALLLRFGVRVEGEYLDGHVALRERVAAEVDLAGGARADLAQHRVLADVLLAACLHGRESATICSRSSDSWKGLPRKALTPSSWARLRCLGAVR